MLIISNGYNKFQLAVAASEMDRRGDLTAFFTGAYPTLGLMRVLRFTGLHRFRKLQRLIARKEPIAEDKIYGFFLPEALCSIGIALKGSGQIRLKPVGQWLINQSMIWYGTLANRKLQRINKASSTSIYHYRAGFGHNSVLTAKEGNMISLCEHSIAHPDLVDWLTEHSGELPAPHMTIHSSSSFWNMVLLDIKRADAILVNSNFVKETFLNRGWPENQIHVLYRGVDDLFLSAIPDRKLDAIRDDAPVRFIFAGSFEQRKGAEVLIEAMNRLKGRNVSVNLDVVGNSPNDMSARYPNFAKDDRVTLRGLLSRQELAQALTETDVFVFPSLAEGSARVVFEALACGCYVITTPNSGSIVEDGVHGRLIPPGDVDALAVAMQDAIYLGRGHLSAIGQANARLIRANYRQVHYGEKLMQLYSSLVGTPEAAR